VGEVVSTFLRDYVSIDTGPTEKFSELHYLAANPDVDQAVRAGTLESGFHHWKARGRSEGRALTPEGEIPRWMANAGAA
jgi:hypothetical protein